MDMKRIAAAIDHAVLKPEASDKDVEQECMVALRYKVASVCVKPCHVTLAYSFLKDSGIKISTVIGFPHGGTTTGIKVAESIEAILNGAEELDMVINIGKLLSGDYIYIIEDIKAVAEAAHERGALLKVILETSLIGDSVKVEACRLAEAAGADFVKTSTGFAGGGATMNDILLMKSTVGPQMRLKASGGIKNIRQAEEFIEAGCERLGTSATEFILSGKDIDLTY